MEQGEVRVIRGSRANTTIVQIEGPLALKTVTLFQEAMRDPSITDTIVDLTAVPFVDSAGLGAILTHFVHTTKNGHNFAITGVGTRVKMMFKTTRADSVLPMFINNQAAETGFGGTDAFPTAKA
jgi:anti-sigma B factor antagonist